MANKTLMNALKNISVEQLLSYINFDQLKRSILKVLEFLIEKIEDDPEIDFYCKKSIELIKIIEVIQMSVSNKQPNFEIIQSTINVLLNSKSFHKISQVS